MKFFIDGILTYPVEVKGLTRQFSFIENNYKANKLCEQPGKFLPDTGPKKRSFRAAASNFVNVVLSGIVFYLKAIEITRHMNIRENCLGFFQHITLAITS